MNSHTKQKYRIFLWAAVALSFSAPAQQKKLPPTILPPGPSIHAATGVSFTDVTGAAGLAGFHHLSGGQGKDYLIETTGSGCAFLDYDNDGWLDIYLVNGATLDALRGQTKAPRAALYHNNHDGTFTDVTDKAGVANERWGQGVCVGDFDNDGWEDIYVSNFGRNRLYRNNHDGTFTDVAERAGVTVGGWSTGCAFGDYDGDGLLDLFVAGYVTLDLNALPPAGTGAVVTAEKKDEGKNVGGMGAAYADGSSYCQYRGQRVMCGPRGLKGAPDHLFRNNGDGTFSEVSRQAGVEDSAGYYGFGVAWFDYDDDGRLDLIVANDYDNDGALDLLVANGHVYPVADTTDWGTSYKQRLLLFRNVKGKFYEIGSSAGVALNLPRASRGSAIGDFDNDGDLDILLNNIDDAPTLLRNDGGARTGHWLAVKLIGDVKQKRPRDAIGATVFCTAGGKTIRAEVASGRGYNSQSDLRAHFGLGAATKVDGLEVRWANGKAEQYVIKAVDRIITIEQGRGLINDK